MNKITNLNEICDIIGDGLHGTPVFSDQGEYCFINGNNLSNGKIQINIDTKKCDNSQYLLYNKDLNDRTILLSINGTIGNLAFYNGEKVILGKSACYLNIKQEYDKKYMYYVFFNDDFQKYIRQYATGTTIKNVGLKTIREYTLNIPNYPQQKEIADVLSSFDDKIENNNNIIKNLEEQAQALYKQWFVDFEFPDENGKPYKSNGGKFKDSELGNIPESWDIELLTNLLQFEKGIEPGSQNYVEKGSDTIEFFRVGELMEDKNLYINKLFLQNTNPAQYGDVLVSFDGTVGRVSYWKNGIFSGGIRNIKPLKPFISKSFIYFLFTSDYIQKTIKKYEASRTTIVHASKSIQEFIIPFCKQIISLYSDTTQKLFDKMVLIKEENQKLKETRDYLLPKLISGEIKVENI